MPTGSSGTNSRGPSSINSSGTSSSSTSGTSSSGPHATSAQAAKAQRGTEMVLSEDNKGRRSRESHCIFKNRCVGMTMTARRPSQLLPSRNQRAEETKIKSIKGGGGDNVVSVCVSATFTEFQGSGKKDKNNLCFFKRKREEAF
jgi:hypothetical protein